MDIGVVIGRFQVDTLHEGHRFLINKASSSHKNLMIFIGVSPREGISDPLGFRVRERMIRSEYPEACILPLYDKPTDEEWSEQIDQNLKLMFGEGRAAVLYGGRDSFVPHYKGKHSAIEVDSGISYMSGTKQREDIGKVVRSSPDFRAGIIYHSQNIPSRPVMCADIAAVRLIDGKYEVLMGKKSWDKDGYRLPGGKVECDDASLEAAARREMLEETGLSIEGDLVYLSSDIIRDWRDGNKKDVVYMTATFVAYATVGTPIPGSDLVELKWIPIEYALGMYKQIGREPVKKLVKRFLSE